MVNHQVKSKLGIIGGMGPEATVLLMSRIIALTEAKDDCDHIPMLVDNNTQVPSRIKAIIDKTGDDPSSTLIIMARELEARGVKVLAMPCNTAHYYADVIQGSVNIPLLNMVRLTSNHIAREYSHKHVVGVLGSPALAMTHIYDAAFAAHNIEVLYPEEQELMLKAIRLIKENADSEKSRTLFTNAANELVEKGADLLVVACSEFSIVSSILNDKFCFVDSLEILAQAVVDFRPGLSD